MKGNLAYPTRLAIHVTQILQAVAGTPAAAKTGIRVAFGGENPYLGTVPVLLPPLLSDNGVSIRGFGVSLQQYRDAGFGPDPAARRIIFPY